ncbi:MAG: CHAT domain-containing protein [Lewinellaceae bacterium]|nr:CHAT domain-containing protein [Saprospiraceae bacterium]MCB9336928.1 CHAT domain-containing protein [Lewinellaceae bacterium]
MPADTVYADSLYAVANSTVDETAAAKTTAIYAAILPKSKKHVDALYWLANCQSGNGRVEEGIKTLADGLASIASAEGDELPETARLLTGMSNLLRLNGNYPDALNAGQKALNILLQPGCDIYNIDVVEAYFVIANCEMVAGKNLRAIESYKKCLGVLEKLSGDYTAGIANIYNNIAMAYDNVGNRAEAINYHFAALDIRLRHFGENNEETASSYNNIGNHFSGIYENDTAILYYEKALHIYENLSAYEKVGQCLLNLGQEYGAKGYFEKAREYYFESLEILKNFWGDNYWQNWLMLNQIGLMYMERGHFQKALSYYRRALGILIAASGTEPIPDLMTVYSNIALTYSKMGENSQAIYWQNKALPILDSLEGLPQYFATIYLNLGVFYSNIQEERQAMEHFERALYFKKIQGERFGEDVYNNIGNLQLEKKQYQPAYASFSKAYESCKQQGMEREKIQRALNGMGMACVAMDNYDRALSYFTESHRLLDRSSHKKLLVTDEVDCYLGEGLAWSGIYLVNGSLDALDSAFNAYQTGLSLCKGGLEGLSWKETTAELNARIKEITEHCLELWDSTSGIKNRRLDTVGLFSLFEGSKALGLLGGVNELNARQFGAVDPQILEQDDKLDADINYLEKKRDAMLSQNILETDVSIAQLDNSLFHLKQEKENLKEELEKDYPDYYRIKYDRSTVSLGYVQDTLLRQDQTLLEYFTGDSSIFMLVVKQDDVSMVRVKKEFLIEAWVKNLQHGLYGFYGQKKSEQTDELFGATIESYSEAAQQLYDKLIAPIKNLLTNEVIVVPDGVLGYVPFEALLAGQPSQADNFNTYPFLIKEYQFSYCYSATLLREMKEKRHKQQPRGQLVAFAPFYEGSYSKLDEQFGGSFDSLFAELGLPVDESLNNRKDFDQLPNSGEEVFAASKFWKGKYYLNSDATEQRFYEEAGNYRIVHLSTHGMADPRVGDYSYLAFAEVKDSIENELLYVRDLYNLQLNADLVVLSACETAVGELQKGEGIISLARAFAYAGAKSIVTTLWVVNDAASKDLMESFYAQLRHKGMTKDRALHLAKRQMIDGKEDFRKHPFFWAAFIPVGDMSAMQ